MPGYTENYAVEIRKCDEDEGGYMAIVHDLPGCMSDGDTPAEAYANVQDAIEAWIEVAKSLGRPVPDPSQTEPRSAGGFGE